MNTENLLTDLFADQADGRPEPGPVLEAVHTRIARQRRVTVTRATTVLAAAAAVAAVAGGNTVATEPSGFHAGPAAGTGAVSSSTPASTAAMSPSSTTAPLPSSTAPSPRTSGPARVRVADSGGYSTINAGWLPGPATPDPAGTSVQPGFEERDWTVMVDGVAMDVIIWTESGSLPSRVQATGGRPDYRAITVNGHPGREFVAKNVTVVAFDLGNGTIAYAGPSVERTTAKVTTARISAIARKVAVNMQFHRHDPIPSR
ncbi:hypothetical protein [uncultured Jatrophihabitans sp.]|uniref:hypothetical protein n=1 Tax=uncultured Jatrophihabitans sp. TaxID=1610747 RepID=UPI0035CC6257